MKENTQNIKLCNLKRLEFYADSLIRDCLLNKFFSEYVSFVMTYSALSLRESQEATLSYIGR